MSIPVELDEICRLSVLSNVKKQLSTTSDPRKSKTFTSIFSKKNFSKNVSSGYSLSFLGDKPSGGVSDGMDVGMDFYTQRTEILS